MFADKLNKLIFISLFLGIISAPCISMFLGFVTNDINDFKKRENRNPSKYPAIQSIAELSGFPSDFENAFNDHFSFRRILKRIHSELSIKLLKVSPHKQLLIGKNGHYFLASSGNGNNDLIFKAFEFDSQRIEKESDRLKKQEPFLRDLTVPVLILAIPTSPLFEFNNLPLFIQKQIDPSCLRNPPAQRVINNMPEAFSEEYLLFPYEKALEANKAYALFPEKNFHWRSSRYTKLVASCIADRFGIMPYKKPGFDGLRKQDTLSDLSRFAGISLTNRNDLIYKKDYWESLNIRDKKPVDDYKNFPSVRGVYYTVNPSQKGKILLVGNSFTPHLRYDVARYFGEVHSINFNGARKSHEIQKWFHCVFEEIRPDYIVFLNTNSFKIFREFIDNFYLIKKDLGVL